LEGSGGLTGFFFIFGRLWRFTKSKRYRQSLGFPALQPVATASAPSCTEKNEENQKIYMSYQSVESDKLCKIAEQSFGSHLLKNS